MFNYKYLYPYVYTLKLLGGTGDGKTIFTTFFAAEEAKKILRKSAGKTNTTLVGRRNVYTSAREMKNKILVALKKKKYLYDRNLFTSMIAEAYALVIRDKGDKKTDFMEDTGYLEDLFLQMMSGSSNIKAVLRLLSENGRKKYAARLAESYFSTHMDDKAYLIYKAATNQLQTNAKTNTIRLLDEIRRQTADQLDSMDDETKSRLWEVWEDINRDLENVFFSIFDKDKISEDGYYYKEIHLDDPEKDKDFIDAFFSNNDLYNGANLSIEVFAEDIVIYAPMSAKVQEIIENNPDAKAAFINKDGDICFGIHDTRGLYHNADAESENRSYLADLLYNDEYDALAIMLPLMWTTNEKKIRDLFKEVYKSYKKQIPVFAINNMADRFLDEIMGEDYGDDEESDEPALSQEEVMLKIDERTAELLAQFNEYKSKARETLDIKPLPCYLRTKVFPYPEYREKFNVFNAIKTIVDDMGSYIRATENKITFFSEGSDEVSVSIPEDYIKILVRNILDNQMTEKKILGPCRSNAGDNSGLKPHGNSYNAMVRRLKVGEGYDSEIDLDHFINCDDISVRFPAVFANFINNDTFFDGIYSGLEFSGIDELKTSNGGTFIKFMDALKKNIRTKDFVSDILYGYALDNAERGRFGFKTKFNAFIDNCADLFTERSIMDKYIDLYAEVIKEVVETAGRKTIAMNVIIK